MNIINDPKETPQCTVCFEISTTITDCNHYLCLGCYKKMDDLPAHQLNMKKCPICRKEHPTLKNIEKNLTDAQKLEHYNTLMEFYTEANKVIVRPQAPPTVAQARAVAVDQANQANEARAVAVAQANQARAVARAQAAQHLIQVQAIIEAQAPPTVAQAPPTVAQLNIIINDHQRPENYPNAFPEIVGVNYNLNLNNPIISQMRNEQMYRVYIAYQKRLSPTLYQHLINDNPRMLGFENVNIGSAQPNAAVPSLQRYINNRRKMIKNAGTISLQLTNENKLIDLFYMNITFDAKLPATVTTRITLGEGVKISDVPFNCRPLHNCAGCDKRTRRICDKRTRILYTDNYSNCNQYCCADCFECGDCSLELRHPYSRA